MTFTEPIIDTDSHLTEPADLWTERLPSKWGDQIMQVRWNPEKQTDYWVVNGNWIQQAWQGAFFGSDTYPYAPKTFSDCHPAAVNQDERVKIMDAEHILAQVLYPNVAGLNAALFTEMADQTIAEAHIRAYNDYQADYAAAYPGRFIPMLVVPFWHLDGAVAEIERTENMGFGGIVMTGAPHLHDQPYIGDHHWDRLWDACVAARLTVSYHIGSGNLRQNLAQDQWLIDPPGATLARTSTQPFLDNGKQITDLVMSGVLVRYPTLNFASVESGLGWIPFVMESMDYHYKRATKGKNHLEWGGLLPSDLLRRQVYVNYWFERLQPWHLEIIGEDNIMFETDFPHPTCIEPDDLSAVKARLSDVSDEVREKLMWRNAARLYNIEVTESTF